MATNLNLGIVDVKGLDPQFDQPYTLNVRDVGRGGSKSVLISHILKGAKIKIALS